jgi:ubiquinone/menaquinone biosynthesis C-methylase UbiE
MTRLQREWDDLAREDPLWVVLSTDDGKFGGWDTEEFLETGAREVADVLARAERLGLPQRRGRALDFGCGVGRATGALAASFDEVVGVDISEAMIARARELHADRAGCTFVVADAPDLSAFADGEFDLVHTRIVLQHQHSDEAIERYLAELVRVLDSEGLLVFQLPAGLPLAVRLQPRRRLYRLLSRAGLRPRTLYWRLGLHPMAMRALPEERVREVLADAGARVLDVEARRDPGYGFDDRVYFAAKAG